MENTLSVLQRWLWGLTIGAVILAPSFREVDYKSYAVSIGFLLLLLIQAFWLFKRPEFSSSPLEISLSLYVVWTCLSYFWSPVELAASEYLGRFLPGIGVFLLVRQEYTKPNSSTGYALWMVSTITVMVFGFLQAQHLDWLPTYFQPVDGRIFSTFGNPTVYAAFLVLSFPVLALNPSKFKNVFLSSIVTGIFSISLLISLWLTQSRAGFVGLAVEFCVLVFVTWPRIKRMKYGRWGLLFLSAVSLVIFVRKASVFAFRPTDRLEIWKDATQMMMARPLQGWGVGQFSLNFQPYMTEGLVAQVLKDNTFAEHAHNEVLELGVELGLVGLLLAGFFWFKLLRRALRQCLMGWKEGNEPSSLILGLAIGLLGLGITNLFGYNCRLPGVAFLLWISAGILANKVFPTDKIRFKAPIGAVIAILLVGGAVFGLSQETRLLAAVSGENPAKNFLKDIPADLPTEQQKILENIKAQPGNPDNYHQLGNLFVKARNFEGAQRAFEKEIELNPQSANGYLNLGNVFLMTSDIDPGRLELARVCYEKYIQLEPEGVDGYLDLAYVCFFHKDLKGALAEVEKALKIDPRNPQALSLKRQILP